MNFVLVHGAWHGGWCWRHVAERLREHGHQVFTPTLTGLGERAHLLDANTGLSSCIADIAGVIAAEELQDVVLVGHSFAGPVITGVADRMPERLKHLVYLDALVVQNGQSALSLFSAEVQQERRLPFHVDHRGRPEYRVAREDAPRLRRNGATKYLRG